jgi:glycosyltransferase involved in cell wall biosynthesis
MPLLIGPTGKMTQMDDLKQFNEWLTQPGFTQATEEQERMYVEQARAKIAKISSQNSLQAGIYLSTVSEGGKDGYGIASKNLIKEFEAAGIPVSSHYNGQKVAILFHNPYGIPRIEAPYRIIYTMFESTKIPDNWLDYLNAADEVWVPSKWNQEVFKAAGVETKVVPLGYDEESFKFIERKVARKERRPFTFLHYNAFNIRKGFTEVWKAFTAEFEKTEPVKLILKTTLNQSPLPITVGEYPNVEVIHGKVPEAELYDIMKRSDCFVFPSRGEGFGMTPLEAMATGLPAIIPNAHGISEYFDARYMYEVKVKEKCPALYARYKDMDVGEMFVSDVADLRKKMRWCVNHQEECIEMGTKAAEYVKGWTYQKGFEGAVARIKEIMDMEVKPRKLQNVLTLEKVR